jgi:hypothetical protein
MAFLLARASCSHARPVVLARPSAVHRVALPRRSGVSRRARVTTTAALPGMLNDVSKLTKAVRSRHEWRRVDFAQPRSSTA